MDALAIPDVYSDGLDRIEIAGPNLRLVYVAERGGIREPVACVIIPQAALVLDILPMIARAQNGARQLEMALH